MSKGAAWLWPTIIAVVLAALAVIQIVRVNRPPAVDAPQNVPRYARGPIVRGEIVVPAGGYLQFPFELNRRTRMLGTLRTKRMAEKVSTFLLTAEEFEKWKSGNEFRSIAQTGYVPSGKIEQVLEPGSYVVVFDNREGAEARSAQTDFAVD